MGFFGQEETLEFSGTLVHPHQSVSRTQPEVVLVVFGYGADGIVGQDAWLVGTRLIGFDHVSVVGFHTGIGAHPHDAVAGKEHAAHLFGGCNGDRREVTVWEVLCLYRGGKAYQTDEDV